MKQKFLLHTCCAVCSAHVINLLKKDYDLTVFYYNPNIQPKEEYEKRKEESRAYCEKNPSTSSGQVKFIEGDYDVDQWSQRVKGCEQEPEGGERCKICYRMRLEKTAQYAKEHSYDYFGTTLTISPHKKAKVINEIGCSLESGNIKFYEADFKKHDGFKKTMEIAKDENFYRQNYCGCLFSRKSVE